MANPFYINNDSQMYNIKSIYNAIKQSNNPYQTFLNLAGSNPQMQPIIQALQKGTSPEQLFNSMCQQRGIDPKEFIKKITN